MTDNEIIKALEICGNESMEDGHCISCPCQDECYGELGLHALEKAALDLIKRQQDEIEELKILTGLQRKRKYYNRFVKEVWQKEHGKLSWPDFDRIYKRYFEQQERFDRIVERLEEMKAKPMELVYDVPLIDSVIKIVKAGGKGE